MKINTKDLSKIAELNFRKTTYEAGQSIYARVVKILDGDHVLLEDKYGHSMEAKLTCQLNESSSKYIKFIITDIKDNSIYVKINGEEIDALSHEERTSIVLKNLCLSISDDNKEVVENLVKHGIPVTKENIFLMKKLKLSFKKAVEILTNNSLTNTNTLHKMDVFTILKEIVLQNNKDFKSSNSQSITSNDNMVDYNRLAFMIKNNLELNLANLEHINNIIFSKNSLADQFRLLAKSLEQNPDTMNISKEFKQLSSNLRTMIFDNKMNFQGINEKLANTISNIIIDIQNKKISDEKVFIQLQEIKESLDFINKIDQFQTVFQFPVQLNNKQQDLELFFLKSKNSNSEQNKQHRVFLSLDTNSLNKVQIIIETNNKNISVKFYLKDGELKKIFSKFNDVLIDTIKDIGYEIVNIDFVISRKTENLLTIDEYDRCNKNSIDIRV